MSPQPSLPSSPATSGDSFTLYDLRVDVICPPGARILCGAKPGDHFFLEGELLRMGEGTRGFSIYSLAAILPLLPAKQRPTHAHDWMTTDAEVACPDPLCGSRLRITRIAKREFSHSEVSGVPLKEDDSQGERLPTVTAPDSDMTA
ncbi:hypothetical protein PENSPDRAFT_574228 [Peniophora sp. CONT]|nr:hypothetical protein PENSPDRAFT_574228 [Peniophora sp. CONT]